MKSLRSTGRAVAVAGRGQVLGRAAEELAVGEHGQGGRPASLVGGGQPRRVEILGQQTFAGTGPLDFGDHRHSGAGACNAAAKPRTAGGAGGRGQRVEVPPVAGRGRPVGGQDAVQVGGHGTASLLVGSPGP